MDPTTKSNFLDHHAAAGAARFGISPADLTFIGGFQNFIYAYMRDGLKYMLRFTPSTLRTLEGIAAELEWIRYVAEHGLSVSVPVPSVGEEDIERIQGVGIDFYATSFTYAPGRKIGYPECLGNSSLYEQCGRMTGRLHELSKGYQPRARRHTWEHNAYLLQARAYIPAEQEDVLLALDELLAEVACLPVTDFAFGLIHGDINVGNFTVDESGELTLFDFDECQYSWYAEDIAVQLYYLLYVFGEDSKAERLVQYELFKDHFEKGYTEEGRQLPDGWLAQLPLFLRLRDMIVYVGMHRSWDLSQPDDWTSDFLRDCRMRITSGISLIDGLNGTTS
ncbi:Ser/Thr protein kinase RdoA (MazF antagonist) [Paenibacillus phyllosphaerae]|uniref:Ser/Thr protein kinase RdoA (MazF antagonist) n=1 Tax=Paenibacillus phyllosphaerae TaxID=274593 RepID=A0A7W5FL85_9BACL|nr:phosphotransferase [Paenibacillus phyllosphaerae]MBB3108764.1 Ser/Thr protein kinase RdoA (MazF antagonist) [Paenibacillus phyllosphaerae]